MNDDMISMTAGQLRALKSALTPELSTTHRPLGPHGLWHTPSKNHPDKEALPDYIENIAHALMRNGHDEETAIRMAIAAVKRWASGGGKGKWNRVHPEVRAAAAKAVAEWEKLRAEHAH